MNFLADNSPLEMELLREDNSPLEMELMPGDNSSLEMELLPEDNSPLEMELLPEDNSPLERGLRGVLFLEIYIIIMRNKENGIIAINEKLKYKEIYIKTPDNSAGNILPVSVAFKTISKENINIAGKITWSKCIVTKTVFGRKIYKIKG
jgi:hypothetical protein